MTRTHLPTPKAVRAAGISDGVHERREPGSSLEENEQLKKRSAHHMVQFASEYDGDL